MSCSFSRIHHPQHLFYLMESELADGADGRQRLCHGKGAFTPQSRHRHGSILLPGRPETALHLSSTAVVETTWMCLSTVTMSVQKLLKNERTLVPSSPATAPTVQCILSLVLCFY